MLGLITGNLILNMRVNEHKEIKSIASAKKIGLPNFFGGLYFGWSQFGDKNEASGIYRVAKIKKDFVVQKMQFYDYKITASTGQIASRNKFALAVSAWQALTDDEKKQYNELARNRPFYGYHLFIKMYMRTP
jgi:hypothetical protein